MAAQRTLPQLFEDSAARYPKNVLIWEKRKDRYEPLTYEAMRIRVHRFAAGLLGLGVQKGDRIALIAEGRNDWVMSELGILFTGAIDVPVSVKIEELNDLKFRLAHSGCRMAVVSQSQAAKLRKVKGDLAELEKVIVLDELPAYDKDEIPAAALLAAGEDFLSGRRPELESRWRSILESDYANICYTSGTTADPKGIILTHRNYTANIEQSMGLVECREDWCSLLILPWDHAFAHTCGVYTLMKLGASMASVQAGKTALETLKNVPVNIKETRPHLLLSVPALAKSFRKNIEKGVRDKGPKVEALFEKALALAYAYNADGWNRGQGLKNKMKKPLLAVYDRILFKKIRANFGGRLRFFVGGGALLDIELQRFFYAIGIPMFQGYGLTEAAPVISSNSTKAHKLGSSGPIAPGLDIEIRSADGRSLPAGEQGEITVRGENVMAGYWKNEKATREVLRDGWLATGDIGYLDADGYLYVLGRMKSLLIANDGEKFSPEVIEEAVAENSPLIEQLMLYNNQSPYTVALLVPNKEAVKGRLKQQGLTCATEDGRVAALKLLEGEIAAYREGGPYAGMFPARWLPSAVAVLGEAFTEQNQMMNSTMKIVRGKIAEFYKNRLEALFTPESKDIVNPQNLTIVGRFE